ncbi:MAG: hypothetical protein LBN35_04805 [Clostridiales Family XIII bacterium]|jgi:hypothetical protein|nr:hypothetical protein [Clostridiales Family XIII bacterium]
MLNIEIENDAIKTFELDVIEGYADDFLLPVSVVRTSEKVVLHYCTEGYVPLCAYSFRGELFSVFSVLRQYVRCLTEARDKLLRPDMLFDRGDMIFTDPRSGAVRLVYGAAGKAGKADMTGESGNSVSGNGYSDIVCALMPLLSELSALSSIVGAKSAMAEIAGHIKAHNPKFEDIMKIIEQTERKWNYVQPVRP